jgi:hypothetical protein
VYRLHENLITGEPDGIITVDESTGTGKFD